MDRYGGPHTALSIALLGFLYLAILLYRFGGPRSPITIALLGVLYLAIIMDRYGGSKLQLI
jgi:hypothetical protein